MSKTQMKRAAAAKMVDDIRCALAARESPEVIERMLQRQHFIEPLTRCDGDAHGNPHIDNCETCAPRWGYVGAPVVIR